MIFIPKELNIGFQERIDTYSGKLAYVTYTDEKGILRKEQSWSCWKQDKIPVLSCLNEPMSGFVLNKKAGGYSSGWNNRQTYTRVYDPRGFEIEIDIENLLYILDNCSSVKGKGLEGEFVYGWSGANLILLPVNSEDYQVNKPLSDSRYEAKKIKPSDMVIGKQYLFKDGLEYVYLGKFYEFDRYGTRVSKSKKFVFGLTGKPYKASKASVDSITSYTSMSGRILSLSNNGNVHPKYDDYEKLRLKNCTYIDSYGDPKKVYHTYESFKKWIESNSSNLSRYNHNNSIQKYFYYGYDSKFTKLWLDSDTGHYHNSENLYYSAINTAPKTTLKIMFDTYSPYMLVYKNKSGNIVNISGGLND